jgi:hypothetical protein
MSVSAISVANSVRSAEPNDPLLDLDSRAWREAIGRSELGIRHGLAGHPSFTLEALAELADRLPATAIERHEGRQPLLVPGGAPDLAGLPSATVLSIDTNGQWMVLWNIEQVPRYRRLLDEILDPVAPLVPAREGAMGRREAFLFLSAPGSVTPVHFDPEHNFLLQIRGVKHFHVGRFPDRAAELAELDRYHDGGHRNLERIPPLSTSFTMNPGEGVYVYPWAPHWVENGAAASISLSITFRTRRSERHELVHHFNRRMRRHGRSPRPPGESVAADRAKAGVVAFVAWLRRGGRRQRGARDSG